MMLADRQVQVGKGGPLNVLKPFRACKVITCFIVYKSESAANVDLIKLERHVPCYSSHQFLCHGLYRQKTTVYYSNPNEM